MSASLISGASLPVALATELRARITAGTYTAGTRLPSEPHLSVELGVSRPTLREALRMLADDGWVVRRHGSGTYVADRRVVQNSIEFNFGVGHLIRSAGREAGTSEATLERIGADAELAERLGIDVGAPVDVLTRVRTADGEPVVHSVDAVPVGLLPDGSFTDSSASLYDLLAEAGHAVVQGIAHLRPVAAGTVLTRALGVARGSALMRLEQTDSDAEGRAVVHSVEHHRPDAFDVVVRRQGPAGR